MVQIEREEKEYEQMWVTKRFLRLKKDLNEMDSLKEKKIVVWMVKNDQRCKCNVVGVPNGVWTK